MNLPDNVIYHNPRCSKSRQTLELLRGKGVELEVIQYLETPPTVEQLGALCEQLDVTPQALCRSKEPIYKELGLSDQDDRSDEEWLQLMVNHPILIERPIVVYKQQAVLGRPPENVFKIIDDDAI